MSPNQSSSVREADGLSLILIDLHVPALTSRLHCSEVALQLSENTSVLLHILYTYHRQRGLVGALVSILFLNITFRISCPLGPFVYLGIHSSSGFGALTSGNLSLY
jgi:hypothetical protein